MNIIHTELRGRRTRGKWNKKRIWFTVSVILFPSCAGTFDRNGVWWNPVYLLFSTNGSDFWFVKVLAISCFPSGQMFSPSLIGFAMGEMSSATWLILLKGRCVVFSEVRFWSEVKFHKSFRVRWLEQKVLVKFHMPKVR